MRENKRYFPEYPELSRTENRIRNGMMTSTRIYRSWGSMVSGLSDEEAGKAFKALFAYMDNEPVKVSELEVSAAARSFVNVAIRSLEDSVDYCIAQHAGKGIERESAEAVRRSFLKAKIKNELGGSDDE